MRHIIIRGAREHNLKNIDVQLPRDRLIVITGLSGSGKSSLAFDTLYAEGRRRYVESLSAYARQFLGLMHKPDMDTIEGLSPAIAIEQKTTSRNPRSTVGTVTEVYDYLRLLFARVGIPHCPVHNVPIEPRSPQSIARSIFTELSLPFTVLAPLVRRKKGTHEKLFADLHREGFTRVRVNGRMERTEKPPTLERYRQHDIELVMDRLRDADETRLSEACEAALSRSGGLVVLVDGNGNDHIFSAIMACPRCGLSIEELQPRMFSFNSPFGACPACHGLGVGMEFDPELIIPDRSLSIADGAVALYRNAMDGWRGQYLAAVALHFGFDLFTPIQRLDPRQYRALMFGSTEKIAFRMSMKKGEVNWSHNGTWEGLAPQAERLYRQTDSDYRRRELEKFMRTFPCPSCGGKRLKEMVLAVTVADRSIADIADLSIRAALGFFRSLQMDHRRMLISRQVVQEITNRLEFLHTVGLGYLTLSRSAGSLSGGEAQRIRLATQIGSNLMGVLYILDEPSVGLHQRDNRKLIKTLHQLRDLGNTVIVVEHDEETIRHADHVLDMGPGAGLEGGHVVAQGTPEEISLHPASLTGQYLSGRRRIPVPSRRRGGGPPLEVSGCREHNLKNITATIPTRTFTVVSGVSGSGKSTLVYDIIYPAMMRLLHESQMAAGDHDTLEHNGMLDKVIVIDQSPIGRTPRSNPATYTKVFGDIRQVFSRTREAQLRGYQPGRFSFNVKGGRCEACHGDGVIKIEMNFLPDVYVECEECKGQRYNRDTLDITFKGHSIADVLNMSVNEAMELFAHQAAIRNRLETLQQVGLGYIKLGQSSVSLSGGEAQRIKLTRELSKRDTGRTLYLLDEPTTGLHAHDILKLLEVLNSLVERGNTVVVIEHNMDVIKCADHIIDLGPEGGDGGGEIVAAGTPEELARNRHSHTGKWLAGILND
ncbi:MAG TPA: excinuclease ABC subunit UvrA [Candidatus Aminicenantes bacterium]|nr:excinuclease ABC subunit UvrA [Candidatus Aminicenantes bacterium]